MTVNTFYNVVMTGVCPQVWIVDFLDAATARRVAEALDAAFGDNLSAPSFEVVLNREGSVGWGDGLSRETYLKMLDVVNEACRDQLELGLGGETEPEAGDQLEGFSEVLQREAAELGRLAEAQYEAGAGQSANLL